MPTAEQVKSLISSHFQNDADRFNTVALQIAAHEARQGHISLADDIRVIIDKSRSAPVRITFHRELDDLILETEPKYRLGNLIVSDDMRQRIYRILKEFQQQHKLKKYGLMHRRKILLAGPPGTGKTMTAEVLAHELRLPFYVILMDKLVTKYMGETSAKLRQIFDLIGKQTGVYLFDEFDAIGGERSSDSDVGEMRRVLNAFLQFIERDSSDSMIVAATNNLGLLDQALFRRFDDILHYELPTKAEIAMLVEDRLGMFKGDLLAARVAGAGIGLSHAEISQACDDAVKESVLNDASHVTSGQLSKMLKDRRDAYGKRIRK